MSTVVFININYKYKIDILVDAMNLHAINVKKRGYVAYGYAF